MNFRPIVLGAAFIALATSAAFVGPASAIDLYQDRGAQQGVPAQPSAQGTQADQDACRPDAHKFCGPVLDKGDLFVLACLKDNRPNISRACNQVLVTHGQ